MDLSNRLNWDLAIRSSLSGTPVGEGSFLPIQPLAVTIPNQFAIVSADSSTALPHWKLACWASVNLLINPSSTAMLPTGSEILRKFCALRRNTLLEIPDFEPRPYLLILEIPHWINRVTLEVWYWNP